MNKAEEFMSTWLDKKYSGAKELGDWTPNDVVEIMKEYSGDEYERGFKDGIASAFNTRI